MSLNQTTTLPEVNFSPAEPQFSNETLSVIIRCHKPQRLPFLDEALFSLAIQFWQHLEVVVVLQNGSDEFRDAVLNLIKAQPFSDKFKFQIHNVPIPAGMDGRSSLLNHGIERATGRYLAFLDDDDVVYQHGYEVLIKQLIAGKSAVAVGGCRRVKLRNEFNNWYVETKETPFSWGRSRFDLFKDNFIPIHSYVIDRTRTDNADLYFDDDLPPLEDYDFLLRISAKYDFDFSKLDVFVCEYRIHGDNSLPYTDDAPPEIFEAHSKAMQAIAKRKSTIMYPMPLTEILNLLAVEAPSPTTEKSLAVKPVNNPENLRVFQTILDGIGENIYDFFRRHKKIEKKLSDIARYGWTTYSKNKSRKESGGQEVF